MKSAISAIILILLVAVVYLIVTRKPSPMIIGPSQVELDSIKAQSKREKAKLLTEIDSLITANRHDSTMRAGKAKQDRQTIKKLTDKANSLLAQLNDSLPCCEASEIKSRVIGLKDSVIEKQGKRILDDSLYIQNLQANFERRIGIEQRQRQLLEDENKLLEEIVEAQKAELPRQRKKGFWNGLKLGTPVGVVLTVILIL